MVQLEFGSWQGHWKNAYYIQIQHQYGAKTYRVNFLLIERKSKCDPLHKVTLKAIDFPAEIHFYTATIVTGILT